jgi:hypothetical protein
MPNLKMGKKIGVVTSTGSSIELLVKYRLWIEIIENKKTPS